MAGAERARRREEGGEVREGTGAGRAGPCGPRGELGLLPQGGGSPGGLWVEEGRDLSRGLTGALWWLLRGGQIVRARAGAGVEG